MKFLMLTTYATPSNMRRPLLEAIRTAGHTVTVVAPEPASIMGPAVAEMDGTYVEWHVDRTRIAPIADMRSALQLYRILRAAAPEVVLVYQIKAVILGTMTATLARVPNVVALVNGLGSAFDDRGFGSTAKGRTARATYRVALRGLDRIVFQNHEDPQLLLNNGILSKTADWRVVPGSGVDLDALKPGPPLEHPVTFTLVSRLLISKGVREFVAAGKLIRKRSPQVRLRLVGQLEDRHHPDAVQRDEIDAWVADGLVEYLGFSSDVVAILRATTVFVLPSYYREGVPRTNLEALALGLPIITTDSVGCRDTVVDGVNGFLVPPRDVAALADRMARYLRDPELAIRHGAASRGHAARFDINHVNELMLDALGLRTESR